MNALNSFSFPNQFIDADRVRMREQQFERVFESKGLFIVPYSRNEILAYMKLEFQVISTDNESRSLWANPEIGFYGYCHARRNKQPYGSPVQLNQRYQEIFYWNPPEQYNQIELIASISNLALSLGAPFTSTRMFLPGPTVTDFSFGFQRAGRYKAILTMGYYITVLWEDLGIDTPTQSLPDPEAVEAIDPGADRALGDPETPLSRPYREGGDFGESDLPEPEPPGPPLPTVNFVVVYNASGPGFDIREGQSFEYTGPPLTSLNLRPQLLDGAMVLVGTSAEGEERILLRGALVTEEQNQAFINSFQFVRYLF